MITTFEAFGYELPKKTCFELIRQAGFDGVLLWWSDNFGDSNFRQNPKLARDAGLFVENIHTPFEKINNLWRDNLDGDALLTHFLEIVDECANYQVPTMVMHLSKGDNPPPFNALGLNRIKRIVERAERSDVNLALENLRQVRYLDYVMSRIDSPRVGFCYDSGHHNCRCQDVDLLAQYGNRLMSLHLHDNDGTGDHHLLPFDGTINWPQTMSNIAKAGFNGPIAMEAFNIGHERLPPDEFLQLLYTRAVKLKDLMKII
ncbi:MAG: sugar phosphate isomerase/epimerase [Defluviitaleaceae bacterium]|nr:sugar phosphate isomerase/epimerase [Defluviitaleaceae bacterium]